MVESGIRIGTLILAGLLSFQSADALPKAEEPSVTEAVQETTAPVEELEEALLYTQWLPNECLKAAPEGQQGTVLIDQVPGYEGIPHPFTVYLPPRYDGVGPYDLLIFLGPTDGEMGDCINVVEDTWYTPPFKNADIFDQLILQKRVKPFILVQPDYLHWEDLPAHYDNTALSIKNELLPYVAEHYGTYASSGAYEDLVAAREHIAMGGASLGGMHTFRGLMKHCTDVAACFCPMSCNIDMHKVQEEITSAAAAYPIKKLMYTVGGIEEPRMKEMPDHVRYLLPQVLTEENMVVMEIEKTHHFYSTWAVGLWNSLQYLFRDDL